MAERNVIRLYRLDGGDPPFAFFPDDEGADDGGRDYLLPEGYAVDSDDGAPFIRGKGRCVLQLHNGLPVLVDEAAKRAFLLERDRKIERAREARGLSREELAAELGETQLQLYRWETYEEEPGTALLGRIARILGCSTEELL